MEPWDRNKQLFEFSKEFIIHGEHSLQKLLTGQNAKHSAYQTAEAMSYLLPRGADFVATVVTGWLDRVDKTNRRSNKLKVQFAIDHNGNNSTTYRQTIRNLLLKSAVEIFNSFELQLQFVFRRINDKYNSVSRTQAIKVLAEFASKACTKYMTESTETFPENWRLHESVLTHDKKLTRKIIETSNHVLSGQDKLILMLDNGQKIISKSDFFKMPIAAFSQDSGTISVDEEVLLKKDDVRRWKDGGGQSSLLRRPFDFEWKQMLFSTRRGKTTGYVNLPRKKNPHLKKTRMDLSNFKWSDPSSLIQELYHKIGEELPLESIDDLYSRVDNLIVETKENLTKTLGEIQGDLKTELLKNNQVVLKVLETVTEVTTCHNSCPPETFVKIILPLTKELRYNIRDPIPSFTGRSEFIEEIHKNFVETTENFVLSHVKVISGLGGIGKTEAARKYIHTYENCYKHIIWIDSETNNTMTQNFRNLAQHELNMSVKTQDGNWRSMKELVKDVYEIICHQPSLFIFDDAECYEDWEQPGDGTSNNGIKHFLPASLNSRLIKPKFLITSRNQGWKLLPTKTMPLNILTKEESIQFITHRLGIASEPKMSHTLVNDLAHLLGGLPLSLQVAAACIHKLTEKKSVNVTQAIQLYIEDYKVGSNSQEFLHYFDKSIVPKSIFLTMLLSFEKIQKAAVHKFGFTALKLIKYISFLSSDEIPKDLIFFAFPNEEPRIEDSLALLKSCSLVEMFDTHIAVHRQVQQATIEKMKEDGEDTEILMEILHHVKNFIYSNTLLYPILKMSMTSAVRLVSHLKCQLDIISTNTEVEQFVEFTASTLFLNGRHLEAHEMYTILWQSYCKRMGEQSADALAIEFHVARCLEFWGNFDEALQKYRKVYEQQKKSLDDSNPAVWKTLIKIAAVSHFMTNDKDVYKSDENYYSKSVAIEDALNDKAKTMLRQQLDKYEESIEMFQNVFEIRKSDLGGQQIVRSEDNELNQSLFQEVLKKLQETLGAEHPHVLAHYNISSIFAAQRKYEQALNLLRQVVEKRRKSLGDHLSVFLNQMAVAFILIKQGHFKEAADLCSEAYEGQRANGGDSHPQVTQVVLQLADTMYTNQMYQDAWNLYRNVDTRLREGHSDKLKIKHSMGLILIRQKRYWDAFKLYESVYEMCKEIHGDGHPDVLTAQMYMTMTLKKYDQYIQQTTNGY